MAVITQKRIYRDDLKQNPDVLYVFGDNTARAGMGGQAGEMRGEPNAVGVCTKAFPSMSEHSFWNDNNYEDNIKQIDADFRRVVLHLIVGGMVVLPAEGLGTGLSELPTRAPKTHTYLSEFIEVLLHRYPVKRTSR